MIRLRGVRIDAVGVKLLVSSTVDIVVSAFCLSLEIDPLLFSKAMKG